MGIMDLGAQCGISLLEELLLLGQVVPTLCFMGRASDKGSLMCGQVLGSFTSYSSHPSPNPQPSPACTIPCYLLRRHGAALP